MSNRGLTLIELLVSLVLLGVALAGLVCLFFFGFNTTQHSQDVALAYSVARQEVETVKNIGFLSLPRKWHRVQGYNDQGQQTTAANPHFTATTDLDPYVADPSTITTTSLRTIRVEVRSKEHNELLFSTESYLTRGGI